MCNDAWRKLGRITMSIGDQIQRPDGERSTAWNWLLWWRINPVDLDEQVRLYDTLPITGSMRGISVLLLAFSCGLTAVLMLVRFVDATALVDIGLMLTMAAFIYFGHRWAMIGAMVIWTLEKIVTAFGSPAMAISQILWWAPYMHAFYFAFRIEQTRKAKT